MELGLKAGCTLDTELGTVDVLGLLIYVEVHAMCGKILGFQN